METYIAEFLWTKDEAARSMRNHFGFKLRPILAITVRFFLVLLSALFLIFFIFIYDKERNLADILAMVIFVCMGILGLFPRQIGMFLFCRDFDKSPEANYRIKWTISAEKIILQSNIGFSEVSWETFTKVTEKYDGYLFYSQKRIYHWLPFSSLKQPDAGNAIEQFCNMHRVRFVKKKH